MTTTVAEKIAFKKNGKALIAGTRIKVSFIVRAVRSGKAPADIVASLTHLTVDQVQDALEYYSRHRSEIDSEIEDADAYVKQYMADHPPAVSGGVLRQRFFDKFGYFPEDHRESA